ncbi:MAG: hypothetical protein KBE23_19360 [Chloroflexi bacterium]|nr:hypothetical protein [Chloroflexota bacterium]MBP7044919.1 hypothetical protein [Chloroflexota bacterium]
MAYGIVIIVVFGLLIVVPLIIAAITQEKSVLKLAGALLGILFALVAVVSYAGIWGIAAFMSLGLYYSILVWHLFLGLVVGLDLSVRDKPIRQQWPLFLVLGITAVAAFIGIFLTNKYLTTDYLKWSLIIITVTHLVMILALTIQHAAEFGSRGNLVGYFLGGCTLALAIVAIVYGFQSGIAAWSISCLTFIGSLIAIAIIAFIIRGSVGLPTWNVQKGLSGQIFGDTANFIAVIAGLSAYNILSNLGSGWWHLGLVAGWLALLVGLSLHRRWLNLTENHIGQWIDEYGKRNWLLIGIVYPLKVAQNRRERASALASEIVGLMTILSVLAPTGAASATNVQIGSWVSFGLLILTAIVLLVYFLRHRNPATLFEDPSNKRWRVGGFFWTMCWLIFSIIILGVFAGFSSQDWTNLGRFFGVIGIICWMLVEILSSWPVTKEFINSPNALGLPLTDYLGWEKNIWEVLGALVSGIFIVFLLMGATPNYSYNSGTFTFDQMGFALTIVFFGGVTMATFGTIRGVINGIINQLS